MVTRGGGEGRRGESRRCQAVRSVRKGAGYDEIGGYALGLCGRGDEGK